jgi:hypothetical protein
MKYIICLLAIAATFAFAQPEAAPSIVCAGVTTGTTVTVTGQRLSAYINALEIRVDPATITCTVTVATSGPLTSRTVYSGSAIGNTLIRPVVETTTNGVVSLALAKEFLAGESLVVTAVTDAGDTNDTSSIVTVIPVIERQP